MVKKSRHKHQGTHKKFHKATQKVLEEKVSHEPQTAKDKKLLIEKEIAMDFAQAVHKKFDRIVRATILFGSQAKNTQSSKSDIDIVVVIDDASINWDLELISWYREELGKIISIHSKKVDRDLHINTIKLTTWWQDLINGDPVILNVLRYGEPLIDSGAFFTPIQALLTQGKIRSTTEAAYAALQRAPAHLVRSRAAQLGAIEGIYWGMVDSAQAALIVAGKLPPSPEHIPQMLKETFVDSGVTKIPYIKQLEGIFNLHKSIIHREISHINGTEVDKWQEIADKFLMEMTRIIDRLIEIKKVRSK